MKNMILKKQSMQLEDINEEILQITRVSSTQMIQMKTYPFLEPDFISARRRSPALRWVYPKCSTILAHCVPLPLPGPPAQCNTSKLPETFI